MDVVTPAAAAAALLLSVLVIVLVRSLSSRPAAPAAPNLPHLHNPAGGAWADGMRGALSGAMSIDHLSPCTPPECYDEAAQFCRNAARQHSHSFAVVASEMPGPVGDAICVIYLLMRTLDLIRDDTSMEMDAKARTLSAFPALFAVGGDAGLTPRGSTSPDGSSSAAATPRHRLLHALSAWCDARPTDAPHEDDQLMRGFENVLNTFRGLPVELQELVSSTCTRMCAEAQNTIEPQHAPVVRAKFEELLVDTAPVALEQLRELVYCTGIPDCDVLFSPAHADSATLRGKVWRKLLAVEVDAGEYTRSLKIAVAALNDPAHPLHNLLFPFYSGAINDAKRACGAWVRSSKDPVEIATIKKRCTEEKISRLVLAFAVQASDLRPEPYFVQGMCNIAAVVLMVLPELDAFYCFKRLYTSNFRLLAAQEFQERGISLKMLKIALSRCDTELLSKLDDSNFNMLIYLSNYFHAGSHPLSHLLRLWDVFVAWGFHLSIIVGVARLVNTRQKIISNLHQPGAVLPANRFPPIDHPDILIDLLVPMLKDLAIGSNGEILDMLWYFLRHPAFMEDIEAAHHQLQLSRAVKLHFS
eukprot:TRINITY_DN4825_c0_g1_i4.p1 TRINITY_DN4825_c0_g1~~TRINITY_DN4825_c0_g1_i4.p1  ORF type:complete len:679 (-),score=221.04 TRINITY_DN4825_c0_g1_i4:351-2105(-)